MRYNTSYGYDRFKVVLTSNTLCSRQKNKMLHARCHLREGLGKRNKKVKSVNVPLRRDRNHAMRDHGLGMQLSTITDQFLLSRNSASFRRVPHTTCAILKCCFSHASLSHVRNIARYTVFFCHYPKLNL